MSWFVTESTNFGIILIDGFSLLVPQRVSVSTVSGTDPAITLSGNNQSVWVHGGVAFTSVGLLLGDSPTDTGYDVRIGATGDVVGTGTAIRLSASGSRIENAGYVVSTDDAAIRIESRAGTAPVTIVNTGHLEGELGAIARASVDSDGTIIFENSGVMLGEYLSSSNKGSALDLITNTGLIIGSLVLGGGDDLYDGSAGRFKGAISAGAGNDTIKGGRDPEELNGDAGNDLLDGGGGKDFLLGGAGNDTLIGGGGGDTLNGGSGVDTASYATASVGVIANLGDGAGNTGDASGDFYTSIENLAGSAFNDQLTGNAGTNVIKGEAGDDILKGEGGKDTLSGGTGNDRLEGGSNEDVLRGGSGNDTLKGDGSDDRLFGDSGNDILEGGSGNDILDGGTGNNTLRGGTGADSLTGGSGADVFRFVSVSESPASSADRDTIRDFSRAQRDVIDLSSMDADTTAIGNQAFNFIGSAKFSKQAGEVRFSLGESTTTILADVDGDSVADFSIRIAGPISFAASDFIL